MTIADDRALPTPVGRGRVSTVAQLALIPEEEIWLQKQKSAHTRRAYRLDVQNAAGHHDPSTTKLYDRRGYNPGKPASFFATY